MNKKPNKLKANKIRLKKIRLDDALLMQNIATSTKEAQALILTGTVLVDDQPLSKAGYESLSDSLKLAYLRILENSDPQNQAKILSHLEYLGILRT